MEDTDASYVAFVEVAWQRHLRLAILLTGDRHRGEDLLQDCLVRIYERWRRLARADDPHAYLRRMLANGNVSLWRRLRRERLVADPPDLAADRTADRHPDAELLRHALLRLPPRQRAVVVLRHYEDLPEAEIAGILGCSVGTVKSQNARALAKLRAALREPIFERNG
ncbi:SigE family RNA polymerase sigma factor [Dactylosporangium sp. NPDC049525]|uniref:SigE family RNA polymerase sigma factor n=1 Tax=Dactylosporangium sp. NPDC049525 TaxID=3154730 RepID=UPI003432E687